MEQIASQILYLNFDDMRQDRCPFSGIIFTVPMDTTDGPSIIEYNLRFSDPETQSFLPRLDPGMADFMLACMGVRLSTNIGGFADEIDF